MQQLMICLLICFIYVPAFTQSIAVNNDGARPDSSAMLDVKSSTKGFLPPRMTKAQILAIKKPVAGLMLYNSTANKPVYFNGENWRFFNDSLLDAPLNGVNADKATAAFNNHRAKGYGTYPPVTALKWNDTLSNAAAKFARDIADQGDGNNVYTLKNEMTILLYPSMYFNFTKQIVLAYCYLYPANADVKTMIDQGFAQSANNPLTMGAFMGSETKQMGMAQYNNRWYLLLSK